MPERFFARSRTYMLPPSTDELVPTDHPVRFIAEVVDSLTDAEWRAIGVDPEPNRRGAPRFAPEALLGIWLAGFMIGIRTSRKLAERCRYDLTFLWLAGGQQPDHNTLWRFYDNHREAMQELLKKTVRIAVEADLLDLAVQAVDGTKVVANAARERSLTPEQLEQLEAQLDVAIAEMESRHVGDDDPPPPALPEELRRREVLRERVREARKQVASAEQTSKINLTDPEARGMHTRQGIAHGYNAQAVVVALDPAQSGVRGRMILATDVTTAADDHGQLVEMIAAAQIVGQPTPTTVADGGYHSSGMLATCEEAGYTIVMPEAQSEKRSQAPFHKDRFIYDPQADTYTCPQGHPATRRRDFTHRDGRQLIDYRVEGSLCRRCPLREQCVGERRGGKVLTVSVHDQALRDHRVWMATPEAQRIARRRKGLIEGVFGAIKEQRNAHRFLLRGEKHVRAEWAMLAIGYNLRTLARAWGARQAGEQSAGAPV